MVDPIKLHGVPIITEKLYKDQSVRRFYVFNATNKNKCNDIGYENVFAIGAPFIC